MRKTASSHRSGGPHVRIVEGKDRRGLRRARLRQEPGQEREGTQEGLHQAAHAGGCCGWLRFRRREDRAAADRRRGAPRARADRLRGQRLGQPPQRVVRPRHLPQRLHHRHQRVRRHLRRREAAVQGDPRNHREGRPAGDLRLPDLRDRDDRRRHRGGVQARQREVRQAGDPDRCAGLRRTEEPGQQAGRRGAARLRDRHGRARVHHAVRHQHHRRVQPVGRAVAGQAAARRARRSAAQLHLGRRPLRRGGQQPTARAPT